MKFKVLQEDFSKALSIANRFVSVRAQLPVLSNIKLKTDKNKLCLYSTNLETSVVLKIGAKVEKEGEISVPSKVLLDLVSNLTTGSILVNVVKDSIEIEHDGFKSKVMGMNTSDFPKIPEKVGTDNVEIVSEVLHSLFQKVMFSVSVDESRPVLTGVLVLMKEKGFEIVATDGFRLSRKIERMQVGAKESVIIPKNSISELVKLLGDSEKTSVSINKKEGQIIFDLDGVVLSSRIINGEFPEYEKIIPTSKKINLTCDKVDLLRGVKLASVFARDSANVVKFEVGKDLSIVSESNKTGNQDNIIDAKIESSETKPLQIAFNYKYLEDFLNVLESDDVEVSFTDANSPGLFLDSKDKGFLHLIMPVRLNM